MKRLAWSIFLAPALLLATDGHFLHGVGPVNQAMGGAGTGLCLDPLGSVAWNPACLAVARGQTLTVSGEIFIPHRTLESQVTAGAFGAGFPQATLFGSTTSRTNTSFLPNVSYVRQTEGSKNTYSVSMLGISGFGVDYAVSDGFRNPILSPQPPNGLGFGQIKSFYALMKMPVTYTRQVSEKLAVAVAAVPAMSMLQVTPAPFAPPTQGFYPAADKNARALGLGYEAGAFYQANRVLSLGAAYHSPIWFRNFEWAGDIRFRMDLPAVVTMGVGLAPLDGTRIAVDVRYLDYERTRGFDKVGFLPTGAVAGFGWRSIWTTAAGVEQKVGRGIWLRGGYNYSQNPIPDRYAFFNMPAPAIVQHHVSGGIGKRINKEIVLDVTYYHAFENRQTGAWISPQGPVPGTSVTSFLRENAISIGLSRRF